MPTRIITASIASNSNVDLTDGKFVKFTVSNDTGAVSTGAVSAARLSVSSCRCYATTGYLDVLFHSTTHPTLASSNTLSGNDAVHAEDFTLSKLSDTLITGTPSTIYLKVVTTTGGGNKINFREGCTITLEIDYTLPPSACVPPSGVNASASTSGGEHVTLAWNAGGGGTNNAASYYEIARAESADGITWGGLEAVTTTTGLSCAVLPPVAYGNRYRYYVRTVGTAGTGYASEWAASANTLQKTRPALVPYTDATLAARTTKIKAAHVLELRTNVNRLRQGLGMAAYSFEELRAGYTSLARWRAHILELRAAIDEMAPTHETWIDIPVNRPTVAVMEQLRRVVAAV